jgi:hypothetical protein
MTLSAVRTIIVPAHATAQEWLSIQDAAGTVRYIPAY